MLIEHIISVSSKNGTGNNGTAQVLMAQVVKQAKMAHFQY